MELSCSPLRFEYQGRRRKSAVPDNSESQPGTAILEHEMDLRPSTKLFEFLIVPLTSQASRTASATLILGDSCPGVTPFLVELAQAAPPSRQAARKPRSCLCSGCNRPRLEAVALACPAQRWLLPTRDTAGRNGRPRRQEPSPAGHKGGTNRQQEKNRKPRISRIFPALLLRLRCATEYEPQRKPRSFFPCRICKSVKLRSNFLFS